MKWHFQCSSWHSFADASSTDINRKKLLPSTVSKSSAATTPNAPSSSKKRSSSSTTPKKANSKDRLGKILKIANSIKSRGGILTWINHRHLLIIIISGTFSSSSFAQSFYTIFVVYHYRLFARLLFFSFFRTFFSFVTVSSFLSLVDFLLLKI